MRAALAGAILLILTPTAVAAASASVTVHAGTGPDGALYFRPQAVTVGEGTRVSLTLVNDDPATPHDWALLEYGGHDIEVYVNGGETRAVNFTAVDKGEFRFICQVVGHKQRGMEGTLVVEDKLFVPALTPLVALGCIAVALTLRRRGA